MSDSEYSSDDDEDYVPECDSASEEEVEPEEKASTQQKSTKKATPKRKRKGGIKLDDDDDNDDDEEQSDDEDLDEQERIEKEKRKQEKDEQAKKAHMEDLWSAFKSDTAHVRAKPITQSTSTKAVPSKAESTSALQPKDSKPLPSSSKPLTNKVSITKTFDFAGEAVTITKTVDADSNEAKMAKKQEEAKKQPVPSTSASSLPLSTKRKGGLGGGLGSVLGQIGKKPKISTLEKSKLDWESFKSETGIADDLKNFNKNGYLERQDFLQRTDERLFEREKETRAAMRSNRS